MLTEIKDAFACNTALEIRDFSELARSDVVTDVLWVNALCGHSEISVALNFNGAVQLLSALIPFLQNHPELKGFESTGCSCFNGCKSPECTNL